MGDALAAEPGEVADRQSRAAFVVGQQAKRVRIVDMGKHVDDGEAAHGGDDRRALVDAPSGDDQSVDPLAEQLLEVAAFARRIVGGVAHEDGDAVIEQAPLQRLDDRKGETAETVGRQDTDRHRARAMQALGEIVRPVVERLGDLEHLGPRFGAEPAAGVERLRGGSDRHAGRLRDIAQRSRAGRRSDVARRRAFGRQVVGRKTVHLTAPESKPEM